jgi:hypothetical protein
MRVQEIIILHPHTNQAITIVSKQRIETMAQTDISVYLRGTECTVTAHGEIEKGGSDSYGSDEPAWVEVDAIEWTRTDGSALPPRTEALVKLMYGSTAGQALIDSVY